MEESNDGQQPKRLQVLAERRAAADTLASGAQHFTSGRLLMQPTASHWPEGSPYNALLQQLQSLEVELHHPGVRCNRERLETLLHPGFHEVGRSGRPYTRDTIIRYLLEERDPPMVVSDGFAVALLAADCALLTYRSAHLEEGHRRVNHTLRSSVWLRTEAGWQLRYHQGTPALEMW